MMITETSMIPGRLFESSLFSFLRISTHSSAGVVYFVWLSTFQPSMYRERNRAQQQQQQPQQPQQQQQGPMRGPNPAEVQVLPLSKSETSGNVFLRLCNLLSWITTMAASCALVLDVMLLCSVEMEGAEATLHCFGIPMALTVVLAEREVAVLLKLCAFLESWLLKGFYIAFVGTLLLAFDHDGAMLDVWRRVAGFFLICTGVLYVSMGALCFKQLRSYQLGKIRRKKVMRQELLSLSSQKHEIEKLLADTESKLQLL